MKIHRTSAWCNIILENNRMTVAERPHFQAKWQVLLYATAWQPIFQRLHSVPSKDWLLCLCSWPIVVTGAGNGRGHLNFNQSNECRPASAFIRAQLSWIINLDCCPSCSDRAHPWVESLPFSLYAKQQYIQLRDWSCRVQHLTVYGVTVNCLMGFVSKLSGGIGYGYLKAFHNG